MTTLAYIPSPPQGVWFLGPIPIRAYALCILAGILLACWWGTHRWMARGGRREDVVDVALFAVPFGLVGGRLYHVATDWRTYFGGQGRSPVHALFIWEGGLGIWGAVALGAVGAWIGCRRKGIPLPAFGDALAPPILAASAIGRFGNYFNQELFGRETNHWWGLQLYERIRDGAVDNVYGVSDGRPWIGVIGETTLSGKLVHPTFLYEACWNLAVVLALVVLDRRFKIGHGRLFALYVVGYSIGRLALEFVRIDPATRIFGYRVNVFTSGLLIIAGLVYFLLAKKGREDPDEIEAGRADGPAEEPEEAAEEQEPTAEPEAASEQEEPAEEAEEPRSTSDIHSPEVGSTDKSD
ncbi:prolipoprotein diacylglyceryl transferase [Segniliparus rugosus]|uniref:Phosphatidylglycerol--prolipoprotein diacylglyceryl transferase n=1 Tax=Segniliparus rugosus (strain ATCC BAA-974 / DSM 45345 / CCUG 50838 / CIP 108380 / JCM 13579 / CDC 945) TaxID=679197 RepID=E5XS45_SEGRC|nr:prolipoprotein diacylglyceryl transferase [Segniliparus rugosus]EFV12830.1 prolipoprotein diacylglyceryl transferase [Segniliparus rugosus ATCC BAA-974]